ncbi:MAG: ABC transporter substrate-binding protein [Ilumatobacteraceae bacterium]
MLEHADRRGPGDLGRRPHDHGRVVRRRTPPRAPGPQTGPGAALGASPAGARIAIEQVNAAGGVLGRRVELIEVDEGADVTTAGASLDQLIDADVDAVVGPASSQIAMRILGRAVRADVLTCSPTATAISLANFPDRDLFVRTIPSDSLESQALGELVELSGESQLAILASDDTFGRDFATALVQQLDESISVAADLRYDPTSSDTLAASAEQALASGARVVALIGAGDSGAAMLTALHEAGLANVKVFVNDGFLDASVSSALGDNAAAILGDITDGVAYRADPSVFLASEFVDELTTGYPDVSPNFAGNAFDCVNLLAVAASVAGSDDPYAMAATFEDATRSGELCWKFVDCLDKIESKRNFALVGPSGSLDITRFGDIDNAVFGRFRFDAEGRPYSHGSDITAQ